MSQRPALQRVDHPETKTRDGRPIRPDADVYLGFGPITLDGMRNAIAPEAPAVTLKLRCPVSEEDTVRKSMQLAAWFGTLGSRSRNGWGSLHIDGDGLFGWGDLCDTKLADQAPLRSVSNALGDGLAADWPHALGMCVDGRPAVWRVVAGRDPKEGKYLGFKTWREVLERLAALKIGFRTQFKFTGGAPHSRVEDRHVLAYPVTNHGLAGLPNARLASQLRFKVAKHKNEYFGLVAHLPCAMPQAFFKTANVRPPEIKHQIEVWQQVHAFLDSRPATLITRIRKG